MTDRPSQPILFDRALMRARRHRAAPLFHDHDFLVRQAATGLAERLAGINRTFDRAINLGAYRGALWQAEPPIETVAEAIECDLSAAMLSGSRPGLVVDEEWLPFRPQSLDLVTSLMTLHMVNDLPGALIQIHRALRPDGLFLGALLGGETLTELRQAIGLAEIECEGGLSPRVAPFADIRDLGSLLQRAGFALPVVDAERLTVRYRDPLRLFRDLRGMAATNMLVERRKQPLRRATLQRCLEIYAEKFALPDGRLPATFDILYLTGWAPHESQQKPLKPGSARMRLADALRQPPQRPDES